MRYVSTRGAWADDPQPFSAILLEGLAPDGGLAVPRSVSAPGRRRARTALRSANLPRARVRGAVALHRRHPGRRPAGADRSHVHAGRLRQRRDHAAHDARAGHPPAARVERPDAGVQGHRAAAARQPVRVRARERRGSSLNILGATSGDTGSSAEYAMRGKRGVARVHALAQGPDEPVPAGADVLARRRRTSTTSRSRACSTTARTS